MNLSDTWVVSFLTIASTLTVSSGRDVYAGEAIGVLLPKEEADIVFARFRSWAEELRKIRSIHFEYSVALEPDSEAAGPHRSIVGRYDFDATTGRAYLEHAEPPGDDRLIPLEPSYATWSGGLGFAMTSRGSEKPRVIQYPFAPRVLGRIYMPSNHPYYPAGRPVATFLEGHRIEVVREEGDRSRYAVAVAKGDPRRVVPPSWRVYFVDLDSPEMIREVRSYQTTIPDHVPVDASEVPADFVLPATLQARYLASRKIMKQFKVIKGIPFPIEWEIVHPNLEGRGVLRFPRSRVTIRHDTFLANLTPEHNYCVPTSGQEIVVNTGNALTYSVRSPAEPLPDFREGTSESVTEELLNSLIHEAAMDARVNPTSPSSVAAVPSSCAANCAYVCLAALRKAEPLHDVIHALGVRPGKNWADLRALSQYFLHRGVRALSVKDDTESLRSLSNTPAILHINRGGPVGHFIAARDFRERDGSVQVIDPPQKPYRVSVGDVMELWSGAALLVDPVVVTKTKARLECGQALRTAAFATSLASGVVILGWCIWRRKSRRMSRDAT